MRQRSALPAGRRRGGAALTACAAGLVLAEAVALAQVVEVARPATCVVGTPEAGVRAERVDAARTGLARSAFPSGGLHAQWRGSAGAPIEHPPLVDARGHVYVVGNRGEVASFESSGDERWRVATAAAQPSAAALLSDDTLVFVDGSGDAVAVRDGRVRWRSRFGRPDAVHPAPLPLDDGGVLVATSRDIAILDVDGRERSRATFPEPILAAPVAALGRVVVITASGAVWSWSPGALEPVAVGTFGSAVHGGAALADAHTLVAVVARQTRLASLDLAGAGEPATQAVSTLRATSPGAVFLGPPALRGGIAYIEAATPSAELELAFDASGREVGRAALTVHPPRTVADAGVSAPPLEASASSLLVDVAGTVAFVADDGSLGVATRGGTVERLSGVCGPTEQAPPGSAVSAAALGRAERGEETDPRPHLSSAAAGLAPLAPGAIVAACRSGAVVAVTGGQAGAARL